MTKVSTIEIAAPNIIAQNRCTLQMALTTLFCGYPNCLKINFLLLIATITVAIIQVSIANVA